MQHPDQWPILIHIADSVRTHLIEMLTDTNKHHTRRGSNGLRRNWPGNRNKKWTPGGGTRERARRCAQSNRDTTWDSGQRVHRCGANR